MIIMSDTFTAITATYVPYIIAELPSNLVLKKVAPKLMLPGMCLCWALLQHFKAWSKNSALSSPVALSLVFAKVGSFLALSYTCRVSTSRTNCKCASDCSSRRPL